MSKSTFSIYYSQTLSMNHVYYQKAPVFSMHTHNIEELIYFKKGNAFYHEDGKTFPLSKNCLIISRSSRNHGFTFEKNSEYERYDALFDVRKMTSDIFAKIPPEISVIHFDDNTHILELFKKMDYYYKHFTGMDLENILLHLVEEILYNVVIALKQSAPDCTFSVNPLIHKAVEYIEEHITASLTVDTLCNELFISKAYLHQIFLKHLQTSPKKYINARKLLLAQKELRTGKKATEVSLTCGFSDYSTFYRDYKKHFGYAPSDETKAKVIHEIMS